MGAGRVDQKAGAGGIGARRGVSCGHLQRLRRRPGAGQTRSPNCPAIRWSACKSAIVPNGPRSSSQCGGAAGRFCLWNATCPSGVARRLRNFAARACASWSRRRNSNLIPLNHSPLPAGLRSDFLKLTSGTTAEPRAIRFTAAQLLADCDNVCDTMGLREDDRNYGAISFAHSYGFSNLITPLLCRGIPLVAASDVMPRALVDGLASSGATVFPGVPAIFRALAELPGAGNAVRLCISAGAPLTKEVAGKFLENWGRKLHSFYGASECGGICYDFERCARRSVRLCGSAAEERLRSHGR